jgi:hypothetical protein
MLYLFPHRTFPTDPPGLFQKVLCKCGPFTRGRWCGAGGGRAGGAGECRACRTPRPKCCPISRSEVDSLCTRTGPAASERCGASVLVVNLSPGRTCSWSAIDGSRTPAARDRRRDGLGTFACAAAFDRSAASATPARARRQRIQPSAAAATAFDGARTSPPEQPASWATARALHNHRGLRVDRGQRHLGVPIERGACGSCAARP